MAVHEVDLVFQRSGFVQRLNLLACFHKSSALSNEELGLVHKVSRFSMDKNVDPLALVLRYLLPRNRNLAITSTGNYGVLFVAGTLLSWPCSRR